MVDSWRSQEYNNYKPKKVLIVGVTENLTARKKFESQLKTELKIRGIDAVESYDVFAPTFTSLKQTEEDIEKEVEKISNNGFDAILISAVKGVDEKTTYTGDWYITDYYWRRFGRYYYLYQDVYFDRGYYNKYKIYNIESSLYNLKENNDKSLVWVASYSVVDPSSINTTVNDYVKAIIKSLENEGIINKIN
ncbi:hypothetical protein GCM10023314_12570 [Algibacter agarivorans]|uniref:Uncharacterized protein n=2 Tax=Algibacter agarivorans TaxID=1109741 RepID=A0ABP9GH11_9FLAO